MISIIGGKFKRKKIEVPNSTVRPTSAKKREAIFSILESYASKNYFDLYSGKSFIDLFAGSGALGLEAMSRGGSFVYFYELDGSVIKVLKKNCDSVINHDKFKVYQQDCKLISNFDFDFIPAVIFIDPPYKYLFYDAVLDIILKSNILDDKTIIVIETDKKDTLKISINFKIIKEKIYGKTKLFFLKIL